LFSFLSSGFEFVALFIIEVCENHAIINQIITPIVIHGMVVRKLLLTSYRDIAESCFVIDVKKKKSHVRAKKTTGNITSNNTEFVLFFLI
jgi:hypothetical protein